MPTKTKLGLVDPVPSSTKDNNESIISNSTNTIDHQFDQTEVQNNIGRLMLPYNISLMEHGEIFDDKVVTQMMINI